MKHSNHILKRKMIENDIIPAENETISSSQEIVTQDCERSLKKAKSIKTIFDKSDCVAAYKAILTFLVKANVSDTMH